MADVGAEVLCKRSKVKCHWYGSAAQALIAALKPGLQSESERPAFRVSCRQDADAVRFCLCCSAAQSSSYAHSEGRESRKHALHA